VIGKVWLLIAFSLACWIFLSSDYGNISTDPLRISALSVTLTILIFCWSTQVYGLIKGIQFWADPYGQMLRGLNTAEIDHKFQEHAADLARTVGITSPKILTCSNSPSVFTFGTRSSETLIVISKQLLKDLSRDELNAVLFHEMFHIREDSEDSSFRVLFQEALNTPITFISLELLLLASTVPLLAVFGIRRVYVGYAEYQTVFTIFYALLAVFVVLMALILVWAWVYRGGLSSRDLYIRELLADSYAAILTRNPSAVESAIMIVGKASLYGSNRSISRIGQLGFAQGSKEKLGNKNELTFAKMFSTKFRSTFNVFHFRTPLKTACPPTTRIALLKKLQELIEGTVKITVSRSHDEVGKSLAIMKIPNCAVKLLLNEKDILKRLFDYVRKNQDSFNLLECAEAIKVEPFEAFLTLVAAANYGYLDF